jgi:hypothetical protein
LGRLGLGAPFYFSLWLRIENSKVDMLHFFALASVFSRLSIDTGTLQLIATVFSTGSLSAKYAPPLGRLIISICFS